MRKLSSRSNISPFVVMDVMQASAERELEGEIVYHLEVGQPGTPAPSSVINSLLEALPQEKLGYTLAAGMDELRKNIAGHYLQFYGVEISPRNVIVTSGSSAGFILSFLAGFNQGERVAVPVPGYPCYRNILLALDLIPVDVHVGPDSNYLITAEHLAQLDETIAGVIVSSPNNPTGTMYKPDVLKQLVEYCELNNLNLISDEIYHGITFEGVTATAAEYSKDIVVINSFSKYFSMTGWRIGWMIVPDSWVRTIERLTQNLFIATSTLSQVGAINAFKSYKEMNDHVSLYQQKRDILYQALLDCGLTKIVKPEGAFYIYVDVTELTNDSISFCKEFLAETGIAITPGVDFDPYNGNRYIRFSFAADLKTISQASEIMVPWFNRRMECR